MDTGLLWYDSDPRRTLPCKIERASRRYREKFGRPPNRCVVHPAALADADSAPLVCHLTDPASTIWVLTAPNMLVHHFWLGESSQQSPR